MQYYMLLYNYMLKINDYLFSIIYTVYYLLVYHHIISYKIVGLPKEK